MKELHIANKSNASKLANADSKETTFQDLSESQTSVISGGINKPGVSKWWYGFHIID